LFTNIHFAVRAEPRAKPVSFGKKISNLKETKGANDNKPVSATILRAKLRTQIYKHILQTSRLDAAALTLKLANHFDNIDPPPYCHTSTHHLSQQQNPC
jgi:hypothetical protein